MKRGQLRAALLTRLGIPSSGDGLLGDPALNDIIAGALRDLGSEYDWPWLLNSDTTITFDADGVGTLPTDFVKARELSMNGRRAMFVSLADFLDKKALGGSYVWTTVGSNIRLTPVPTTAPEVELLYYRFEPAMDNDNDAALCPDAHFQVVLARASYLANIRRRQNEDAMRDDNEYQLGVRKMKDASWARTGPRGVRRTDETYWATW